MDQKLWAALSCPTYGLEFDSKTLESPNADNDSRIRVLDVIAMAKWAGSLLKTEQSEAGDTVPPETAAAPTKTEPAGPSPGEQAPAKAQ